MTALDQLRALDVENDQQSGAEITFNSLRTRIMVLSERAWENRVKWDLVLRWLKNFDGSSGFPEEQERLHALYILSQFLYFGSREIRVLLKALYRDLFLLPLVQEVRAANGGVRDPEFLQQLVFTELTRTRFLGVGNPSESGVHLLYFFRQENGLSKHHFLDTAQIIDRSNVLAGGSPKLRYPDVQRYVFIDDVCGSGETAKNYSTDFLTEVRSLRPRTDLLYLAMFSTEAGMNIVRTESIFGSAAAAVYELDKTYKCLSKESRYLKVVPAVIKADLLRKMTYYYGEYLLPDHPFGYLGSELLLGFHHNTPDNTIPIIWMDETHRPGVTWTPAFRRYPKV